MSELPLIQTPVPGPNSLKCIRELHRLENPHITYRDKYFPVFLKKARGALLWDADGNRYLDMTSAFAVANLGHSPEFLKKVISSQAKELWHAMGDVHPPVAKLECSRRLARFLPRQLSGYIFSSSGSEAVESALKTAYLATGKRSVVAFEGAYHGLGYGALQATHRKYFRDPFIKQTGSFVFFKKFIEEGTLERGQVLRYLNEIRLFIRNKKTVGAILVEPIQGRGGIRVADRNFLAGLRRIAQGEGLVLIFDEIFSGFGRTGRRFAFERYGIIPDLICLGKGMTNGFPLSVCAGKRQIMSTWGESRGEAKHTSTFLGNPLGCAMASAVMRKLEDGSVIRGVEQTGRFLAKGLEDLRREFPGEIQKVRGRGLMQGIVFREARLCGVMVRKFLRKGIIVLPSGDRSEVLSLTPPFVVTHKQLRYFLETFKDILREEKKYHSKKNS